LPDTSGMATYTQGLMDLGATVCLARRPACLLCPLAADCVALAQGAPERYPVKTRKLKRSKRSHALLWLAQGGRIWLVQRPAQGVWSGLWSLPEFSTAAELEAAVAFWPGQGDWLPPFRHVLTHFDWHLQVLHWHRPPGATESLPADEGRWFSRDEALALGLPAPVRKLLAHDG